MNKSNKRLVLVASALLLLGAVLIQMLLRQVEEGQNTEWYAFFSGMMLGVGVVLPFTLLKKKST